MSGQNEQVAESRPRWGTYSVRAHTDLGRLIADALLYDVLVFPCQCLKTRTNPCFMGAAFLQ